MDPDRSLDGGADPGVTELMDDWLASVGNPAAALPEPALGAPPAIDDAPTLADALSALTPPGDGPAGADTIAAAARDEAPRQRYVLFTIADAVYAVRDALITEIGRVPATTPVPHTPAWVRGVTSLRGDVLSVIDLRTFLNLEAASSHMARLIVARLPDEDFAAGLLVDGVDQIASVPDDEVRLPAAPLEGTLAEFVSGVCEVTGRFVAVLDLDRFLRSREIRRFEDSKDGDEG